MQNKDALQTLLEPLLTEARSLLGTEPKVEDRAGVLLRLAHAEDVLGQAEAAKKTRAEAVALARTQPAAEAATTPLLWPTLALAHQDAGDTAGAKAIFAEGVSRAQKVSAAEARFYSLAWLSLYQASPKTAAEARATMALAVKLSPSVAASPSGRSLQRNLLVELGDYATAKKQLLAGASGLSDTVLALGNIATKQAKGGDKAGAKATLAEALKQNQAVKDPLERRMTGEFLLGYLVQIGDEATARKRAGSDPSARKAVATALAEQGDADGARALSREPSSAVVAALAARGKIADAQKEAQRVLADPGSVSMQDEPIRLLGAIAAAQAKAGDSAGLAATLAQARKRINEDTTFGDKRAVLLGSLIDSIVTAGKRRP